MDLFDKLWDLLARGTKADSPKSEKPQPMEVPAPTEKSVVAENGGSPIAPQGVRSESSASSIPAASSTARHRMRGDRTTVIVGFDFGTHSTKVLYRRRNDDVARVLALGPPVVDYPTFASPSLVALEHGCLWFGAEALCHSEGTLYRSLKVRLLGPAAEPDDDYPAGPCPDFLVAAYLAWAFRVLRSQIAREFPEVDIRLNIAAPMDHLEDQRLKTRYLQIVQAAWGIAIADAGIVIDQGVRLNEIEQALKSLLSREVVVEAERKFDVMPETVAAIVSLSMDPRMAPGMYLIVDMGAGTTEISVNYANERGADHRVACYCDQTVLIGGDRFARLSTLPPDQKALKCDSLANELATQCARVWGIGHQKDAPNHVARQRWRSLSILLVGGGTRHVAVRRVFQEPSQLLSRLKQYQVKCNVMSHSPSSIDLGYLAGAESDLPLLVVAHGLTRERQRWPDYFEPASVESLEATATVEKPDSFWYVGGK